MWEVIRKNCTACHGIDDYAFYALDQAGWQKLIAEQAQARRSDASGCRSQSAARLAGGKFGPDTKPFPRTYIPPEITTFFSDPEAFRLMNRPARMSCDRQGAGRPEARRRLARDAGGYAGTRRATLGPGTGTTGGMARAGVGNQSGQMRMRFAIPVFVITGILLLAAVRNRATDVL